MPANIRSRHLSVRRSGPSHIRILATLCVALQLSINPAGVALQLSSFDSRPSQKATASLSLEDELRADMAFLAGDELRGRGSATRDEHIAALFAAAQFATIGLVPGGDNGSFLQKITLPSPLPQSAQQQIAHFEKTPRTETRNVIGILPGTCANAEVILLSAHLDHLGIGPPNAAGDTIYNGADDDASGTTAVLAFARAFARGPRPRRTIVFALFGSEELGGLGSAGFLNNPPIPLASIVANLEFEMIGRPDPALPPDSLWLSGYDRSNLGPELAKHRAHLFADPHPAQNFFLRSDNYALARQGIVAQSISSFGLHKDYHQPSDDLSGIDFPHMINAIANMIEPIRWLADTTWRPSWNPNGKP